jgi:YggT family protein
MSPDTLVFILLQLLRVYEMVLMARILLSWVSVDHDHPIVIWLYRLTDPVLGPARELLFRILDKFGVQLPIDLSPILVFILIGFMERTLASLLFY